MTAAATEILPTGPATDDSDRPFWEGLREDRLLLPRCGACGQWRALGRAMCSGCWSFRTEWSPVAPAGTVHTWVRSARAFMSELDVPVPYVTVLVQLDDVPVRLLGILLGEDPRPAIGDRVTGVIQQPANAEWPVLRWQLAGGEGR
ncbi:Zn-ribbon domain-containing OB-fold protein [Nocardioides sp. NPDC057577]|uniref:Zn-ribbon domain-containing OB-fold protein n=1 Tax=Nocardioides sp. NPDC057577 TaxID=3346171 RepID=UPI003671694C